MVHDSCLCVFGLSSCRRKEREDRGISAQAVVTFVFMATCHNTHVYDVRS